MSQKTAILIGAGLRGVRYTDYALEHKDKFKLLGVGVAEPRPERREYIKENHAISEDLCFTDWRDMLARPKFADFAIITTQDRMHFEPFMAAVEAGYDILIEKPLSPDPYECMAMEKAAREKGVKVMCCFVLRYGNLFGALKEFIMSGRLGKIMNIVHTEGVGNEHQSHSFVRGDWRNTNESAPMILAKSCHDMDVLQWLLGEKCKKVQSFGSLSYFTKENRPEGAPDRCTDGCPHADNCFYNVEKLYFGEGAKLWFREAATRLPLPTDEQVEKALREGDFGRCAFSCDNDVVDHQVVNLEYESGAVASFTMSAFNSGGRRINIMGTKGELFGREGCDYITFYDFATKKSVDIKYTDLALSSDISGGHGGGDTGIMRDLYEYLNDSYDGFSITPFEDFLDNHLVAFAAEHSRIGGGATVDMESYKRLIGERKRC